MKNVNQYLLHMLLQHNVTVREGAFRFFSRTLESWSAIRSLIYNWNRIVRSSVSTSDMPVQYATSYEVSGGNSLLESKTRLAGELKGRTNVSHPILPDISSFNIELGLINPLLLAFGLVARYKSHIILTRGRNSRINRYLLYMYWKSLKALNEGDHSRFWTLNMMLIKRSHSYLAACMHAIDKNLYRNLTSRELLDLIKTVNTIRGKLSVKMEFHRVYIPKGETFRPLGVPTLAWRIYLNMLYHPLVNSIEVKSNQHGFVPGRGTLTAWEEIFRKVAKSPSIFEGDFKQCFPSISLPRLQLGLIARGMPKAISEIYIKLNYCTPIFKGPIKLPEGQSLNIESMAKHGQSMDAYLRSVSALYRKHQRPSKGGPAIQYFMDKLEPIDPGAKLTGIEIKILENFVNSLHFDQSLKGHVMTNLRTWYEADQNPGNAFMDVYYDTDWLKLIGTAQGSPLSPYLSAIALDEINHVLPPGVEILFYADDWILYGPNLHKYSEQHFVKLFGALGFTVNLEKSGWVRKEWQSRHEGLDSIKFLGMRLIFNTTGLGPSLVWKAETKSGKNLVFDKEELLDAEFDIKSTMEASWEKMNAGLERAADFIFKTKESGEAALEAVNQGKGMTPERYESILAHKLALGFGWYYANLYIFKHFLQGEYMWALFYLLRTLFRGGVKLVRLFIVLHLWMFESVRSAIIFAKAVDKKDYSFDPEYLISEQEAPQPGYSVGEAIDQARLDQLRENLEYCNEYVSRYRSRYTFTNFVNSRFKGLLQARMFSGSWTNEEVTQNFKFEFKRTSVAHLLKLRFRNNVNVFNGTSLALNFIVKLSSAMSDHKSGKVRSISKIMESLPLELVPNFERYVERRYLKLFARVTRGISTASYHSWVTALALLKKTLDDRLTNADLKITWFYLWLQTDPMFDGLRARLLRTWHKSRGDD